MALGMGPDPGHRVGVGERPRRRNGVETTAGIRRTRSRDRPLSSLAALRSSRRPAPPRRQARGGRHSQRAAHLSRARGPGGTSLPSLGVRLADAVLRGASERLGKRLEHIRDLDWRSGVALPPDEQYLVATGRTYFKDLS